MLTTLIYRSHLRADTPIQSIIDMVSEANSRNECAGVTGVLLFNGIHFLQLLEGDEAAVMQIYEKICLDTLHFNIVELLSDYAPYRRFGRSGMELIDIRLFSKEECLDRVLQRGTTQHRLLYNDRALRFFRTFIDSVETENYYELPDGFNWHFTSEKIEINAQNFNPQNNIQAVIDPLAGQIHSFVFSLNYKYIPQDINELNYDLKSKFELLKSAGKFISATQRVSVSLLPLTLTKVPDAINILLDYIKVSCIHPEQVIVEFSESEIIPELDEFANAVRKLKSSGLTVAIKDFGVGNAGLMLLTKFQPEKLKIHPQLIQNIHKDGSKQAILQSLIRCCELLEIRICATGIELPEEWMWLESAGIFCFQGSLFSTYNEQGNLTIHWPEPNE
ncbi:cyclic-di-GMP phosphodiesterase [Enterobacter hormaechei]|uniref:diguanylate phosphodiesterase n=1 Tax=Enterobacter hormaechei TaxID=158836 RepID=UPI000791DE6F|nr:diguanylate phosphodiesterase [Enterobacter hormaechei]CZU27214.1 cyclic-di-GMP phosphodiesterase [Enterobacter hormaechei]